MMEVVGDSCANELLQYVLICLAFLPFFLEWCVALPALYLCLTTNCFSLCIVQEPGAGGNFKILLFNSST
jgi:hypothetical protein